MGQWTRRLTGFPALVAVLMVSGVLAPSGSSSSAIEDRATAELSDSTARIAGTEGVAATFRLEWKRLSSGGMRGTGPALRVLGSVGQAGIGRAQGVDGRLGAGFWYGYCDCPHQGDLDLNGMLDAVDLAMTIDVVFFGAELIIDERCPRFRADFDCSGDVDAVDLAKLIDHVFFGGDGPSDCCPP